MTLAARNLELARVAEPLRDDGIELLIVDEIHHPAPQARTGDIEALKELLPGASQVALVGRMNSNSSH